MPIHTVSFDDPSATRRIPSGPERQFGNGLVHRALAVVKLPSMKDRLPSFATVPIATV